MVITITGLCDRPHGDTCLQLLVSAPPRAAWCTLIMSVCVSEMKCYGLNVCTWMLCLCASVIVFTCACTHQFGSIFTMVSLICVCVCACVCVWIHLGLCAYVCVLKCVFRSSVSAQYPSAGKPSINLSTPRPTVSPFLFPLAFLPSFPFISHLTLSLLPLSYFIPVTYSRSHFRHYHTTLPPSKKKRKNMRARWVCPLPPSVLWIIFFMLLSVQNLYILLCALKTFKSSGEKENFRVTVTGFLSLTHTHTRACTHQDLFILLRPFPPLLGAPTARN